LWLPGPGQQFGEPVDRMGADAGDDVGQPNFRLDAVHAGGTDQRVERGSAHAAGVRSAEEPVFAAQSRGADFVFRGIVADLEAAVVEIARQGRPARSPIADGFGEIALARDFRELGVEPDGQFVDFRSCRP